jgi:hypothetical protein
LTNVLENTPEVLPKGLGQIVLKLFQYLSFEYFFIIIKIIILMHHKSTKLSDVVLIQTISDIPFF